MAIETNAAVGSAPRRRGVSMADVARRANVSGQTVSRVSNGKQNVDTETRERVLEAMRALGYRPNSAARALRTGRFHSIGVIMFTLSSFGNMRTLDAIAIAAADAGYSITLIPVSHPTQGEVSVAFHRLSEEAVDGVIIIVEAHLLDETDIVLPPELPVVVVDSAGGDKYPVVDTDQVSGARRAVEYLLELGHRTVWHIAGPERSYSAERRRETWESTLRAAGAPVPEVLVGDWSSASGYRIGRELAADPSVTAIFAANDQMALGVLRALHEAGRAVPGDVSVVGFDDMEESACFWPPLTTVRQFFGDTGRRSVDILLRELESGERSGVTLIPTGLVVRESTGPARA
ncbi:substrate-binding domain-containing protein [Rathayibacter sp. VKM Ac-2759]|uniref:LacI family DNA-binding transcriptional regulator n=1 Tax=Rathayibacter sp. VKM Ac-2759 TaxID=2609252 RepID=UPI00131790C9|nr:LacI family DNA-binding transcriptional regulator [Rathayibacter sp. VKM Ac-2759]QHC68164.1 substrate-binding domain-containing protein [Rathayibacter sp. VKM Ac-2759]